MRYNVIIMYACVCYASMWGWGGMFFGWNVTYSYCSKQHKNNSYDLHRIIRILVYILIVNGVIFYASTAYSGESYAGIYVPTLVNTIRIMNERATSDQQINLKGFMV